MVLGFGHLIGAWIFGKSFEFLTQKRLAQLPWFFLLFGAILPDVDLVIGWILNLEIHRTFTHSIVFALVMGFAAFIWCTLLKEKNRTTITLALFFGICIHIFIDLISQRGVMLFWPYEQFFSFINGFNYISHGPLFERSAEHLTRVLKSAIFDMGLGVTWVFFLWLKKDLRL